MGRKRISGPAPGAKGDRHRAKAPAGLRVIERDGNWHVSGTLRVKGRSVRIRRSTDLPAQAELWEDADAIRRQAEGEIRNEIIHGVKPSRPLGIACGEYLGLNEKGEPGPHAREVGPTDGNVLAEIVAEFGDRLVSTITAKQWNDFLDRRHAGNSADTRQRYCNPIISFLEWCADSERGYLTAVPAIKKRPDGAKPSRTWQRSARRAVAELRPDLLVFLFSHAAPHLKAQLYTEWSTGARVSSVLFACSLADLVLTEKRKQITFHDTKNGDDVTAVLHPAAVAALEDYLAWRGDLHRRDDPLFLTQHRRPYSERGREKGYSGANKTAVNAMKRRAIHALLRLSVRARRAGDRPLADQHKADARLIRKVTQHWLRHWLATHSMAANVPDTLIMAQQGWRDPRSLARYKHDVEGVRRQMIDALPIGGASLLETEAKAK